MAVAMLVDMATTASPARLNMRSSSPPRFCKGKTMVLCSRRKNPCILVVGGGCQTDVRFWILSRVQQVGADVEASCCTKH
jgi:hypothetical protein